MMRKTLLLWCFPFMCTNISNRWKCHKSKKEVNFFVFTQPKNKYMAQECLCLTILYINFVNFYSWNSPNSILSPSLCSHTQFYFQIFTLPFFLLTCKILQTILKQETFFESLTKPPPGMSEAWTL